MAWIDVEIESVQAEKQRKTAEQALAQQIRKEIPRLWERLIEVFRHDVVAIERSTSAALRVNHTREFLALSRDMNDYLLMIALDGGAHLIRCQYASSIGVGTSTWLIKLSEGGKAEFHSDQPSHTPVSCEQLCETLLKPVLRLVA